MRTYETNEPLTMGDMGDFADGLYEGIMGIYMNPKYKAEKQMRFRIRIAWKNYFKDIVCDDEFTKNILNMFKMAVGWNIDTMNINDIPKFITKVTNCMREINYM